MFILLNVINIAFFKGTEGKGNLFGAMIDQQCTPDKGALIVSTEIDAVPEVKYLRIEDLAPDDRLFIYRNHFMSVDRVSAM